MLYPTIDMTRVDRLFATAAGRLRDTIADTMESLGADESSTASIRSFSNTIPFCWERTQAYCKKALQSTAWERYVDWYNWGSNKRKSQPEGEEGNARNASASDIATSQASGSSSGASSITPQLTSMSPPTTPEKTRRAKKAKSLNLGTGEFGT
jgi:hypothetical protein